MKTLQTAMHVEKKFPFVAKQTNRKETVYLNTGNKRYFPPEQAVKETLGGGKFLRHTQDPAQRSEVTIRVFPERQRTSR